MIVVTRLNATRFAINPDLIERIQENPDTVVVLVNGAKYVVTESMEELIGLIAAQRARVVSLAHLGGPEDRIPSTPQPLPRRP